MTPTCGENVCGLNNMNNCVMANVLTTPQSQDSAAVTTTKKVAEAKTRTGTDMEKMVNYPENAGRISLVDSKNEIGTSSFLKLMGRVLETLGAFSSGSLIAPAEFRVVAAGPWSMVNVVIGI